MRQIFPFLFTSYILLGCVIEEIQNPPTVITKVASDVTLKNATLNGEVTEEGFSATTDRGFVFSEKNTNPSVSDSKAQSGYGKGIYSVVLDKLTVNTKYFFKAYATNTKGTTYGEVQSFTTADYKLPIILTDAPKNITNTTAELSGTVTDEGGGGVNERGFCFGVNSNPSTSDNKVISSEGFGAFKANIQNLKDNTKYYVRAYAINSKGIGYGNEQSFITTAAPKLKDIFTKVVEVKSKTGRIWMDRNLGAMQVATSVDDWRAFGDTYQWGRGADGHQLINSPYTNKLSNLDEPLSGSFILPESVPFDWRSPQNNNLWQGEKGTNNPCPVGFRIPTIQEWDIERLSWGSQNTDGAFNSPLKLPAPGRRDGSLPFYGYGRLGEYYSSTIDSVTVKRIGFNILKTEIYSSPRYDGLPVRCIRDK